MVSAKCTRNMAVHTSVKPSTEDGFKDEIYSRFQTTFQVNTVIFSYQNDLYSVENVERRLGRLSKEGLNHGFTQAVSLRYSVQDD